MAITVKYGQRFIFSERLRPLLRQGHYTSLLGSEIEILLDLVNDTECSSILFRCVDKTNPFYDLILNISRTSFLLLTPIGITNREAMRFLKKD